MYLNEEVSDSKPKTRFLNRFIGRIRKETRIWLILYIGNEVRNKISSLLIQTLLMSLNSPKYSDIVFTTIGNHKTMLKRDIDYSKSWCTIVGAVSIKPDTH